MARWDSRSNFLMLPLGCWAFSALETAGQCDGRRPKQRRLPPRRSWTRRRKYEQQNSHPSYYRPWYQTVQAVLSSRKHTCASTLANPTTIIIAADWSFHRKIRRERVVVAVVVVEEENTSHLFALIVWLHLEAQRRILKIKGSVLAPIRFPLSGDVV